MRVETLPSFASSGSITSSNDSIFNPFGKHGSFSLNHDQDAPKVLRGEGGSEDPPSPFPHCHGLPKSCKDKCVGLFRTENLKRTLPIIEWLPKYDKNKAIADLIAGVTVGLTVLPQGLAYASVAGVPPIYGLYSSFVGCFVYLFFGSTTQITIGPTAINSVLTHRYTYGKPPEYAIFLCAVTAVVSLFLGIFRLGFIANFISTPVISGFTSAVALTIVGTQLQGLLGLKFDGEGFLSTLEGVVEHWNEIHTNDALLSIICLTILIVMKQLTWILSPLLQDRPRLAKGIWFFSTARSALILCVCTLISASWEPENPKDRVFSIVGKIPPGIPEFKPPPMNIFDPKTNTTHTFYDILREESSALIVLPILGLMGHITIAKAFSGSKRVDCTQEILTIGISNAISCFFSSYSIAGSFSRTTVNAFSGVATPMGGIYTGTMVLLALQFATQYFYFIPMAALAAVICSCVIFMVDVDIILPLWRSKKMDLLPLFVTFSVTLGFGLEYGIFVGFIISATFLLYYAARPKVRIVKGFTTENTEFLLVQLDRSLTFPSVDYIIECIGKAAKRYCKGPSMPIVLDCHNIMFSDFTAVTAMKDLVKNLDHDNYSIIFWKMKPSILRMVSGVMEGGFTHCSSERELESAVNAKFFVIVDSRENSME